MSVQNAYVAQVPECDIHKYELGQSGVPAAYDMKTLQGPWASVCGQHFKSHTNGQLGVGKGQRYVVGVPAEGSYDAKRMEVENAFATGNIDEIMDAVGDGDIADYM